MTKNTINDATLVAVELFDDECFKLSAHLKAMFAHEEESTAQLENCRDAPATVQWTGVEIIVRGRGWDMAEGEEKDWPTYGIYGRMVHLGIELDEAMAQLPGCGLRLAAIQSRVRQLLDDTIEQLRAQMRQAEERITAEWLASWQGTVRPGVARY